MKLAGTRLVAGRAITAVLRAFLGDAACLRRGVRRRRCRCLIAWTVRRSLDVLLILPVWVPLGASAQLSSAAAQPEPIDGPWSLSLAPQLEEHPLAPGMQAATFGIASNATGTLNQDLSLKGSAELRRVTAVVQADAIHYDVDRDVADAFGHVKLTRDGNEFIGPDAHLHVDSSEGTMTTPTYHFILTDGRGHAARIDLLDNQRETIYDGTYSTCQCVDDPTWYLRASRLDLDNADGQGVAYNSVLFFGGVPIFASPWMSFPLNGERRSGVLPPTFSISSTNGYDLTVPIYFNLAPNYDLTLTPRLISRRGAMLSADYRYLTPTYSGTLSAAFLPDDALTKTNRYSITFKHQQTLGDGFSAYVDYNRVSDANVTTDLASTSSIVLGGQSLFQQEAGLRYNSGPWSALVRVQNWQSFSNSSPPYNRMPELNGKYERYGVDGFDFGATADATRFTIPTADSTQGERLTFDPYVSYPIQRPGWYVIPKLQWHFASYDLTSISSTAPAGQPKSFNFNVPTLSLDSGATFERNVSLFGVGLIQTLEPRLYYVYTPYRNQNYAPVFDTAPLDFGLSEIFTSNRFVGGDRVADMNRLTAGLTTRFIDAATGVELARFTLAQEYYFRSTQVTMPGDSPPTVGPSNLVVGGSLNLGNNLSIQQGFAYNQSSSEFTQATAGFSWKPANGKVVNVGYLYAQANATLDDQAENQVLLSGQWPLTRRLSGVGLMNYDLVSHRIISGLLGLQYAADCWALSLAFEKYTNVSSTTTPSTGTRVLMQLQLNGVSKIDNGLLQQFRANVPGYSTAPSPSPASPFSNYP
ncbi:LPS-assembly protein LptD [Paraburkholderia susongensis]|uniref:LPS-assembly protein LptD n=1 Tax=Paraburkholderia susongensis TaxID=1515439 RepID=A0A1X7IGQ0_9BURK|nr:LPS-assembly protein LptD [Paraburkholderia susongensis]SMG13564.1 LPS-assembly protein [Paraburkholderia susongensis]